MLGPTPWSRCHFSGALVPDEPPLGYVSCGGGWVVLRRALKFPQGMLVLRPLGRYRPRLATAYALPRATWQELQNNPQMAATCAGLWGAQERPNCKLRPWLLLMPDLGPFSERDRAR